MNLRQQMRDSEIRLVAYSLSFSTALALIPFIAVVLALFQSIGGLEAFYPKAEALFLQYFRETGGAAVPKVILRAVKSLNTGKLGISGAIFLFITSLRLLHDMEMGFHRVSNRQNTRPWYKRFFVYWLLVLVIPLVLAGYVVLSSLEQVQLVKRIVPAFITTTSLIFIILFLIYKFVPLEKIKNSIALWVSAGAAVSLYVAQKGFFWLSGQFFNYSKIYGSFAAIPLFLLWILTVWYIILGGAVVCASFQKKQLS
ncbi:MAG: YhjD/YihY/BrkB family envelope integrity protein [Pseudobdellovibrionaceae bacterium]